MCIRDRYNIVYSIYNIHRYSIWCYIRLTKSFKLIVDRTTTCMLILLIEIQIQAESENEPLED